MLKNMIEEVNKIQSQQKMTPFKMQSSFLNDMSRDDAVS